MRWLRGRFIALSQSWQGVLTYVLIVAVAATLMSALIGSRLGHSGLMYVGFPWLLALAILFFELRGNFASIWTGLFKFGFYMLAVMIGVSLLMREGFICVLFFIPIYMVIGVFVFLIYVVVQIVEAARRQWLKRFQSVVVPVLVLLMSLEGTTDSLSFDRWNHVYAETETHLSRAALFENLRQPMDLNRDRGWLLGIFPMPYDIVMTDLQPGEVHIVKTRYHRWFVTNTHEGEVHLLIKDVTPDEIVTEVIHDTSYVSTYLSLQGTSIRFAALDHGGTRVSIALTYRRNLDPAWYFHPLQRLATTQFAGFLLKEVVVR